MSEHRIHQIAKGLDPSDVYIEPELSGVAQRYVQDSRLFVARRVFPGVPVKTQGGKYRIFSKADYLRDEMQVRADGAQAALAKFRESTDNYFCDVFALATDVGPQTRKNSPMADANAAKFLAGKGLLKSEVQFADAFWGTGKWTTEYTGADNTPDAADEVLPWTDPDADPIEQIETAIDAYGDASGGFPINRFVISGDLWVLFKNHPNVLARFNNGQTTGGAKVTRQALADLLEIPVDGILIANARKTTSAPGVAEASSTYGRILSTGLLLCHAAETPSEDTPSAGYHFDWDYNGDDSGGIAVFGEPVPNTRGSIRYEIEHAFDAKQVAADLGIWFEAMDTAAA